MFIRASPWQSVQRLVAALELVGGVWGLVRAAGMLIRTGYSNVGIVIAAIMAVIFGVFLVAGARLWLGRSGGVALSILVQALQLPHIVTSAFGYLFGAPVSFAVGLAGSGHPMFSGLWHPGFGLSINSEVEVAWLGVNLVALAALVLLIRFGRPLQEKVTHA